MIKLMIFDHDMTIVDSVESIRATFEEMAKLLGIKQRVTREKVMDHIADPLPEFLEGVLGEYQPEWIDLFIERSPLMEKRYLRPFPDLEPTIKALRKMGLYLAVASNRENPKTVMTSSGIAHLFDELIGGFAPDGHHRPYKPDPTMLIELMDQFHVPPEQTAYVGDSDIDIEAARRANMRGIGIPRGHNTEQELFAAGAWRVIHSLEELPALAALEVEVSKSNGNSDNEAQL